MTLFPLNEDHLGPPNSSVLPARNCLKGIPHESNQMGISLGASGTHIHWIDDDEDLLAQ